MTILTTAIDCTNDTLRCGAIITLWGRGIIDIHLRLTNVGAEGLRITLFVHIGYESRVVFFLKRYQSLTTSIDIAVIGTGRRTDTSSCDGDGSLSVDLSSTNGIRIIRSCRMVSELIWPAQSEPICQTFMLWHVREVSILITGEVDQTNGCYFTTSIDILLHLTARDINKGASRNASRP